MQRSTATYITDVDRERLKHLIQRVRDANDRTSNNEIMGLEDDLEFADVVQPQEIPADIVTMRSKIKLTDLDSGETSTYTIVFPTEADSDNGRISILAPLAAAVLGRRIGEIIEFKAPSRQKRVQIKEMLYQPEASGDFSL